MSKTAEEIFKSNCGITIDYFDTMTQPYKDVALKAMQEFYVQELAAFKERLRQQIKTLKVPERLGDTNIYREADYIFACDEILKLIDQTT